MHSKKETLDVGKIIVFTIIAMLQLFGSDGYKSPYVIIFVFSLFCMYRNKKKQINKSSDTIAILSFSVLFTVFVCLANHGIWDKSSYFLPLIPLAIGVLYMFYCIFFYIDSLKDCVKNNWVDNSRLVAKKVFWICFGSILLWYVAIFILSEFPGEVSPDSLHQILQTFSGVYSNHHPVVHTWIIKLIFTPVLALGYNMNVAVAAYSVISIIFMSTIFAYGLMTVAELGMPLWTVYLSLAFYMLMPYHILYSMTMWKDVVWGGIVLLFTILLIRVMSDRIRHTWVTQTGFVLAGLGVCLFRSNGLFSYVIVAICFILAYRKSEKRKIIMMVAVILGSLVIKHPVYNSMNIIQPDLVEMLSIPAQQIARVVTFENDLSDDELDLLSQVVNVDAIPETYVQHISDPIKALIRETNNYQLIKDRKWMYGAMYISIGMRHPLEYMRAWVEQTKGYWNGGYEYWRWADTISENEYGIHKNIVSKPIQKAFANYCNMYNSKGYLHIFVSIGFFVWLNFFALFINLVRKSKLGIIVCIPIVSTLLSLVVSTPVAYEFRYIYAAFCTVPIVLITSFGGAFIDCGKAKETIIGDKSKSDYTGENTTAEDDGDSTGKLPENENGNSDEEYDMNDDFFG